MSVGVAVGALLAAGVVIAALGSRLTGVVDRLADRTGIGEAVAGAVVLGAATSIAGLVVSVVAALDGDASLAVSNSLGGIAAQTTFIVVADLAYRRINLEHAAASITNLFNVFVLLAMLAVVVMGMTGPGWTVAEVAPATPLLVLVYLYGLRLARRAGEQPMWFPRRTSDTRADVPDEHFQEESLRRLVLAFLALAAGVAGAGWVVGAAAGVIIDETGVDATVVGTFLTSVTTSLPELVTTVAAVRAGALTLAVAGIVGGNTFDVLFIAAADVAFRDGSVYAAAGESDVFVLGWTILLTALLGGGLVLRDRRWVGFEGVGILVVYALGLAVVTIGS